MTESRNIVAGHCKKSRNLRCDTATPATMSRTTPPQRHRLTTWPVKRQHFPSTQAAYSPAFLLRVSASCKTPSSEVCNAAGTIMGCPCRPHAPEARMTRRRKPKCRLQPFREPRLIWTRRSQFSHGIWETKLRSMLQHVTISTRSPETYGTEGVGRHRPALHEADRSNRGCVSQVCCSCPVAPFLTDKLQRLPLRPVTPQLHASVCSTNREDVIAGCQATDLTYVLGNQLANSIFLMKHEGILFGTNKDAMRKKLKRLTRKLLESVLLRLSRNIDLN